MADAKLLWTLATLCPLHLRALAARTRRTASELAAFRACLEVLMHEGPALARGDPTLAAARATLTVRAAGLPVRELLCEQLLEEVRRLDSAARLQLVVAGSGGA